MPNDDFEFNSKGFDKLLKTLEESPPMAKLGVLGDGGGRSEDGDDNAAILLKHEFGSGKLPIRSVLRVPIILNLEKYVEKSGFFNMDLLKECVDMRSLKLMVAKLGIVGEQIVADAFKTRGFGQWKESNMAFKKNHETLVETGQLRTSITSVVESK